MNSPVDLINFGDIAYIICNGTYPICVLENEKLSSHCKVHSLQVLVYATHGGATSQSLDNRGYSAGLSRGIYDSHVNTHTKTPTLTCFC